MYRSFGSAGGVARKSVTGAMPSERASSNVPPVVSLVSSITVTRIGMSNRMDTTSGDAERTAPSAGNVTSCFECAKAAPVARTVSTGTNAGPKWMRLSRCFFMFDALRRTPRQEGFHPRGSALRPAFPLQARRAGSRRGPRACRASLSVPRSLRRGIRRTQDFIPGVRCRPMDRVIRFSLNGDTIPVNGQSPEANMPLAGTDSNDDMITTGNAS